MHCNDFSYATIGLCQRYLAVLLGPIAVAVQNRYQGLHDMSAPACTDLEKKVLSLADVGVAANFTVLTHVCLTGTVALGPSLESLRVMWSAVERHFKMGVAVTAPSASGASPAAARSPGQVSAYALAVAADPTVGQDVVPAVGAVAYTDTSGRTLDFCKYFAHGARLGGFTCTKGNVINDYDALRGKMTKSGVKGASKCVLKGCWNPFNGKFLVHEEA